MSRIERHPILDPLPPAREITIVLDGRPVAAREGETIAAALIAAGIRVLRHTTKRAEPRSLFCAIGRCTDCAMTVDGVPNVRTCITLAKAGMVIETQRGLGVWRLAQADEAPAHGESRGACGQ